MIDFKIIETKMGRASTLPILPHVTTQLLAMSSGDSRSLVEFERLIAQDAGLTSKILRTANSPYYGGNGQITSLQRAVSQLGINTLRSICLTVGFQSAVTTKQVNKSFNAGYFWQHSMGVACAAKVLACLHQNSLKEEAFIAGLMHDIGKLALAIFLPEEAGLIYQRMEQQKLTQGEAEELTLGGTHQDIGRMVVKSWGIPEAYLSPIAQHHTPILDDGKIDLLTAYVHVGNALTHDIGLGFQPRNECNEADSRILHFLKIPEGQYEAIRQAVANEIAQLSATHGLY
jgi:HD-like signal output (HDOD) protein